MPPAGGSAYARRMVAGVLSGTLQILVSRLVGLLTLPLLLHLLGLNLFGLWAIVSVVVNSQFLIDFGMASVIARFVAAAEAAADRVGVVRALGMGVAFYGFLSLFAAAVLLPMTAHVSSWFGLPHQLSGDARLLWIGGVCLFAISNVTIVLSATLLGLQRLSMANLAVMVSQVPYAGLLLAATHQHWGATGLLAAVLAMNLTQITWMAAGVLRHLPPRGGSGPAQPVRFRLFLRFGSLVQLVNTADFYALQAPKVVAGIVGGSAATARLDLSLRLPMAASALLLPLLPPLIPSSARLAAARSEASLAALFQRATRYMVAACGLVFTGLLVIGPDFLAAWLGKAGAGLDWPVRLSSIALLFYTLPGIITSMGTGAGRMRVIVEYKGLLAACLTVLLFPLAKLGGITGVAAGLAAAFTVAFVYLVLRADRVMGAGSLTAWTLALRRGALASAGAGLVAWLTLAALKSFGVHHATWVAALAAVAGYAGLSTRLRLVTPAEMGELFRSSPLAALGRRHRGNA